MYTTISICILDTEEALVKDSELEAEIKKQDEEEDQLQKEEEALLEELSYISEKHRKVEMIYEKVNNNLKIMLSKEESNEATTTSTLNTSSEYEKYLKSSLETIKSFIKSNKKEKFEEIMKEKGHSHYGKYIKPDKFGVKTRKEIELMRNLGKSVGDSNEEYDYCDPEIENEDKKINEVTYMLIEENKKAINKKREEMVESLRERNIRK